MSTNQNEISASRNPKSALRSGTQAPDFSLAATPKGEVARDYGVYRKSEGVCERALFVIDGKGRIAWSYVSPIAVNPGADGILKALENLSAKEEPADGNQPGRHADAAGR